MRADAGFPATHVAPQRVILLRDGTIEMQHGMRSEVPSIEEVPEGLRIGCTLVTTEAVEQIIQLWIVARGKRKTESR